MEDLKDLYVVSIKVFNPTETLNKFKGSAVLSKVKNIDFVIILNYLKKRSEKVQGSQKSFNFQYFDTDFYFQKHFENPSDFFSENLQKIKAFEFLQTNEFDIGMGEEVITSLDEERLIGNLNSLSFWRDECKDHIKYSAKEERSNKINFKLLKLTEKILDYNSAFLFKRNKNENFNYFFKFIRISNPQKLSHFFLNFGNYYPSYKYDEQKTHILGNKIITPVSKFERTDFRFKYDFEIIEKADAEIREQNKLIIKEPFNMLRDSTLNGDKSRVVETILKGFPEGEFEKTKILDVEDKKLLKVLWVLENLNNKFSNETISKFGAYKEKIGVSDYLFDNMKDLDELSSFLFNKTKLENITTKKQCEFCLSLTSREDPLCQFCFYDVNLNDFYLMENTIDVSENKLRELFIKIEIRRLNRKKIAEYINIIEGFEKYVIYNYNKEIKKWWVFKKASLEDVRKKTSYSIEGYNYKKIDEIKLSLEELKKELDSTKITEGDMLVYNKYNLTRF